MTETNFEGLSKRERKELKKKLRREKEEEAGKSKERKKTAKKIMGIGIIVLFVIFIGFFLFQEMAKNAPDPRGSGTIKITSEVKDFGNVSVGKGTVSTSMEIVNEGKGKLVLTGLKSSCMCTTAVVIIDGVESPVFDMHKNPYWSKELEPGKTAQLKIFYDPTAHPELRGTVTRTISIYSNDPSNPEKTVRINVNQVA
ncbi:DUF1573 domain-containing protein [Candidatus Micrarchaeota archaeon]|nr:DUF1573 domain-containing protein [Candidatus Micrarchaeota archaeon]MBU2476287.1 DUF1573 domain-containing protein [Candidatus Micrarchaeota archaeon]